MLSSEMMGPESENVVLESLVRQSRQITHILHTLRAVDGRLFVGAGVIRNRVWDHLHDYRSATPIVDVDVVYFDSVRNTKQHDLDLEARLTSMAPDLPWSVHNQARMHVKKGEKAYASFEDALSKWPETATAIAVRLEDDDRLTIVAPHGLSDLFGLIVTPTPHFKRKIDIYTERLEKKGWGKVWPKLRFVHHEETKDTKSNLRGGDRLDSDQPSSIRRAADAHNVELWEKGIDHVR